MRDDDTHHKRPTPDGLRQVRVRAPWHRFMEEVEPLRPELYRYCRYLTRSPWDAEDLVQDTLARAFVTLGTIAQDVEQPKAWLLRVASNAWFNRMRHAKVARAVAHQPLSEAADVDDPRATREAAGTLLSRLTAQERAALVLKDVFDFAGEEIAVVLSTSPGAVKSALHRARAKLGAASANELEPLVDTETASPHPEVLSAFAEAFNRRDLERLTALLLDSASIEFPGLHIDYGAETARRGSLAGVLFGDPSSDNSGIAPEHRSGLLPAPPRAELRQHRGETLLLAWFSHDSGEVVRAISRFEFEGALITRVQTYLHHPELLAELCTEMNVPFASNGYRHWW